MRRDRDPRAGATIERVPVWRGWLPAGDAGTRATLAAMRRVARQGATAPIVRTAAAAIYAGAGSAAAQWIAVRSWLARRWRFVPDPQTQETIYTPRYLLEQLTADGGELRGDCDDAATLGAALALAGGLRPRFVVIAFRPYRAFRHVYTEVRVQDDWRELDVTKTAQSLPRDVSRTWYVEV